MSDQTSFSIEQFYKNVSEGKLVGGKCRKCGKIQFPPRPICGFCYSRDFESIEIPATGKLLTHTIIHIAPVQFQQMTPYAVGIIQLDNGVKLPGIIKETSLDKIAVDMSLRIEFEPCQPAAQWPRWPRYYFRPA